jgi:hypothetical protein
LEKAPVVFFVIILRAGAVAVMRAVEREALHAPL